MEVRKPLLVLNINILTKGGDGMRFEIFLGRNYLYYFRYIAANGQIIVTSGDGYTTKNSCIHAINLVKQYAGNAPVFIK